MVQKLHMLEVRNFVYFAHYAIEIRFGKLNLISTLILHQTQACGVCSSTQDLAGLIQFSNGLEQVLISCIKAYLDPEDPSSITPEAVQSIIFCVATVAQLTPSCASLWVWSGLDLINNCLEDCIELFTAPQPSNNPDCTLNNCLQCDELHTLPIFEEFAGRRRGRTGLMSLTVRNCNEMANIEHFGCSTDADI